MIRLTEIGTPSTSSSSALWRGVARTLRRSFRKSVGEVIFSCTKLLFFLTLIVISGVCCVVCDSAPTHNVTMSFFDEAFYHTTIPKVSGFA